MGTSNSLCCACLACLQERRQGSSLWGECTLFCPRGSWGQSTPNTQHQKLVGTKTCPRLVLLQAYMCSAVPFGSVV